MEVANNEQWSSKGKWLLKSLQGGRYVGLLIPPNSCWLLPMGLSFLSTVEEVSRRHICKGVFADPPSKLIITVSVWLTGDKLGNSCPRTWGAGERAAFKDSLTPLIAFSQCQAKPTIPTLCSVAAASESLPPWEWQKQRRYYLINSIRTLLSLPEQLASHLESLAAIICLSCWFTQSKDKKELVMTPGDKKEPGTWGLFTHKENHHTGRNYCKY